MTGYVYRVVNGNGEPVAIGSYGWKAYDEHRIAQRHATTISRRTRRSGFGPAHPKAACRVQRAAVVWEDE